MLVKCTPKATFFSSTKMTEYFPGAVTSCKYMHACMYNDIISVILHGGLRYHRDLGKYHLLCFPLNNFMLLRD